MGKLHKVTPCEAPASALGFEPETFRSAGRRSKQLSYPGRHQNEVFYKDGHLLRQAYFGSAALRVCSW
jgi:hypothetical protein